MQGVEPPSALADMNPTLFPIAIGTPELPRESYFEAQTYKVAAKKEADAGFFLKYCVELRIITAIARTSFDLAGKKSQTERVFGHFIFT